VFKVKIALIKEYDAFTSTIFVPGTLLNVSLILLFIQ